MKSSTLGFVFAALVASTLALAERAAPAQEIDAAELVRRMEDAMRRSSSEYVIAMTIETPRWTRTLRFRSWDDRASERSFTRILEPKKDRGTGFLKIEKSLWTYLPSVERVTRLPPSLLLQSWMGSDFSNDDIVRDTSLANDYVARYVGEEPLDGVACLRFELRARETAPVVWARIDAWGEKQSLVPRRFVYFEDAGGGGEREVRALDFSDVRLVQGRPFPHRWVMEPRDKPGHRTSMQVEELHFDAKIDPAIFTQDHLKRAEAVR